MEKPFGMRPEEIAKLTDAQIFGLYGRDRDEKTGVAKPVGVEGRRPYKSPEKVKEEYLSLMRAFGASDQAAEQAWEKAQLRD